MTDWRDYALCRGQDTNLWYPSTGEALKQNQAISICMDCLVRLSCLEEALSSGNTFDDYGVRGGLTEKARRRLKEKRRLGAVG